MSGTTTPAKPGYGRTNNIKMRGWLPGRCVYAYADVPWHRADSLFARSEIPVRFSWNEMRKHGKEYVIVFCRFAKRHETAFLDCMAELERAMTTEGHADYGEFCDETLGPLLRDNNTSNAIDK